MDTTKRLTGLFLLQILFILRISAGSGLRLEIEPGPYTSDRPVNMICSIEVLGAAPNPSALSITVPQLDKTIKASSNTVNALVGFRLEASGTVKLPVNQSQDVGVICQFKKDTETAKLHVYKIWKEKKTVFENDPVSFECPFGDQTMQKWLRKTDQNGESTNFSLQQKNMPSFRYYINSTGLVDEGRYECSEGQVVVLTLQLIVDVKGTLFFNVSNGPYEEGTYIHINCEVPRAKGNLSANNLQLSYGDSHLYSASTKENSDRTKHLFIYKTLRLKSSYYEMEIICRYTSPNGTIQEDSVSINVTSLYSTKKLITTIVISVGSTILIGLILYGAFRYFRKMKKRHSPIMEGGRPYISFRISQYDQIDESEIQHPDEVQPPVVCERVPSPASPKQEEETAENTEEDVPANYIEIISSSSSEGSESPKIEKEAEAVVETPKTGWDMATPYKITVFKEPFYENEGYFKEIAGAAAKEEEDDTYDDTVAPSPEEADKNSQALATVLPATRLEGDDGYANMGGGGATENQGTSIDEECTYVIKESGKAVQSEAKGGQPEFTNECASEMEEWLRATYVSDNTCRVLQAEMIKKMADLKALTKEDIQGLSLPLGEQVRLRRSLEKLRDRELKATCTTLTE